MFIVVSHQSADCALVDVVHKLWYPIKTRVWIFVDALKVGEREESPAPVYRWRGTPTGSRPGTAMTHVVVSSRSPTGTAATAGRVYASDPEAAVVEKRKQRRESTLAAGGFRAQAAVKSSSIAE
eukprot:scaffold134281_cov32-Tisochrysis_lutea.AAC.3